MPGRNRVTGYAITPLSRLCLAGIVSCPDPVPKTSWMLEPERDYARTRGRAALVGRTGLSLTFDPKPSSILDI